MLQWNQSLLWERERTERKAIATAAAVVTVTAATMIPPRQARRLQVTLDRIQTRTQAQAHLIALPPSFK